MTELLKISDFVRSESVFSCNEQISDINTCDLKYITIEYIIADLLFKKKFVDRKSSNAQTINYLDQFFERCLYLGILSEMREKQIEVLKTGRSLTREEKLQIVGLNRVLNQDLESGKDDLRDFWLQRIEKCMNEALDLYSTCQMEKRLLLTPREAEASSEPRSKPFVLLNTRQKLQDQVFQPSHRLPTMSIDEYLQRQYNQGNIISGGGKQSLVEEKELTEDEEMIELIKQRRMDEFKDDNPRGWGNRYNKS